VKIGAANLAAARAVSAEAVQKAVGPALVTQFWPVFDGSVIPGDLYVQYCADRHKLGRGRDVTATRGRIYVALIPNREGSHACSIPILTTGPNIFSGTTRTWLRVRRSPNGRRNQNSERRPVTAK